MTQLSIDLKRLLLATLILVSVTVAWAFVRRILPSSIEYRGQKIKLTKFYLNYDEYKNDPDNIDPSEIERVQRLVSEAPIAHSFANRKEASLAVFEVKFPGYAAGGFGGPISENDGSLNGFLIEIPRSDKARYFIFRKTNGNYVLIDDFIASGTLELQTVREEHGNLVYSSASGESRLVHPMRDSK